MMIMINKRYIVRVLKSSQTGIPCDSAAFSNERPAKITKSRVVISSFTHLLDTQRQRGRKRERLSSHHFRQIKGKWTLLRDTIKYKLANSCSCAQLGNSPQKPCDLSSSSPSSSSSSSGCGGIPPSHCDVTKSIRILLAARSLICKWGEIPPVVGGRDGL